VSIQFPTEEQVEELDREFRKQSDRGLAIVACAYLETQLRWFLEAHLSESLTSAARKQLFEGPAAPIGTFSARVAIAEALRLLGPHSVHDLASIRRIRNEFAHHFSRQDFDDPNVTKLCNELRLPDIPLGGIKLAKLPPRGRFIQAVTSVVHGMNGEIRARARCPSKTSVSP
jgi:mannitol operon repressor